ncbi:hypothetical protein OFM36_29030, partial [Escherichia coli]|nr:hypothetical protein [Escherichia coli]
MKMHFRIRPYPAVLATVVALSLTTTLFVLPILFETKAIERSGEGIIRRTSGSDDGLQNYDIRLDKSSYMILADLRS